MTHRAHDYDHLIRRWRAVARAAGLRMERWHRDGKYPLYVLRTGVLGTAGGIHLSAGIHGDEPGASEGLIAWAEAHAAELPHLPLLIVPCMNPWGLVNNTRVNRKFEDLNRLFHRNDLPLIAAWKELMEPYQFAVSMTLHEDFDGQGIYLYEVLRDQESWGHDLLALAREHIPIEPRRRLDGKKAAAGLIKRRLHLPWFNQNGYPEAVWMHLYKAGRCYTVETPSEYALPDRVAAQAAVVEGMVQRVIAGAEPTPLCRGGSVRKANVPSPTGW